MKKTMTAKQIADYEQLCKDRDHGRLLSADGLRLLCEANDHDPEAIGKHMLEVYAKLKAEGVYDIRW